MSDVKAGPVSPQEGRIVVTTRTADELRAISDALRAEEVFPAAAYGPDPSVGTIVPGTVTAGRYLKPTLMIGAIVACLIFVVEAYGSVIAYPINASNKPLFAWPAFWVTSIDGGLLVATLACLALYLLRSGLPRWHRDDVPAAVLAAPDRFHAVFLTTELGESRIRTIVESVAPGADLKDAGAS